MEEQLNLATRWEEVKEKLKEVNYELTDEDLDYKPGEEEKLLKRIGARLGKDTEWVKGWIESVSFTKRVAS